MLDSLTMIVSPMTGAKHIINLGDVSSFFLFILCRNIFQDFRQFSINNFHRLNYILISEERRAVQQKHPSVRVEGKHRETDVPEHPALLSHAAGSTGSVCLAGFSFHCDSLPGKAATSHSHSSGPSAES